jgi:hypothetical protein
MESERNFKKGDIVKIRLESLNQFYFQFPSEVDYFQKYTYYNNLRDKYGFVVDNNVSLYCGLDINNFDSINYFESVKSNNYIPYGNRYILTDFDGKLFLFPTFCLDIIVSKGKLYKKYMRDDIQGILKTYRNTEYSPIINMVDEENHVKRISVIRFLLSVIDEMESDTFISKLEQEIDILQNDKKRLESEYKNYKENLKKVKTMWEKL